MAGRSKSGFGFQFILLFYLTLYSLALSKVKLVVLLILHIYIYLFYIAYLYTYSSKLLPYNIYIYIIPCLEEFGCPTDKLHIQLPLNSVFPLICNQTNIIFVKR